MFELSNKIAIITGASSGIGYDVAIAYAKAGADVCLLARRTERLEQLKNKIEQYNRRAMAIHCDVTDENSVKIAIESIINEFGKIDILMNNAGVAISGGLEETSIEEWDRSFAVNSRGQFLVSKYVIPHMIKENYGKIINISSVNAVIGDKYDKLYRIAYNASKAAVVGLTTGMAANLYR